MRLLISGSRDITDPRHVREAVEASGWVGEATEIVHGAAKGVDSLAHDLFEGVLPVKTFPAEWYRYGPRAGPQRNAVMADYADKLIAVMWTGGTRGTLDMIAKMKAKGKPVFVWEII